MDKTKFIKNIDRYHLAGICEPVKWAVKSNKAMVKFSSEDQMLIGQVVFTTELEDSDFGMYTTSDLLKIISPLDSTIKEVKLTQVDGVNTNILLSDDSLKVKYVLSSLDIIPKAGNLKKEPEFEIELEMNKELIGLYLKSISALPDTLNAAFCVKDENNIKVVLGYSTINTNTITFDIPAVSTDTSIDPIVFHAQYLKQIFSSNKDMIKGKIFISSAGIMKIQFSGEGYGSMYYLVKLQEV